MINGEEGGDFASDFPSPDPLDGFSPWLDQRSEADGDSHVSSGYSSCGESELDRYCSANSVLGAASFCSSLGNCNDFLDSDLWLSKNLEFGNECVLENFGSHVERNFGDRRIATVGGSEFLADEGIEFQNEDNCVGNGVSVQEENNPMRIGNCSKSFGDSEVVSLFSGAIDSESRADNLTRLDIENEFKHSQSAYANTLSYMGGNNENNTESLGTSRSQNESDSPPMLSNKHSPEITDAENFKENLIKLGCDVSPNNMVVCKNSCTKLVLSDRNSFQGLSLDSSDPYCGAEFHRVPEEQEETSSRYEHSDDESSMFDGTDDECNIGLSERKNLHSYQSSKTKNENPLLINSAVAFGSNDWNEFMLETEENNTASVLLDEPQKQLLGDIDIEKKVLNSVLLAPTAVSGFGRSEQEEYVRDISIDACQIHGCNELLEDLDSCSVRNILAEKRDPAKQMSIVDGAAERKLQWIRSDEVTDLDESRISESKLSGKLKPHGVPISEISQISFFAKEELQITESGFFEDNEPTMLPLMIEDDQHIHAKTLSKESPASGGGVEVDLAPVRVKNHDLKESYDEVVLEMEEILLDSTESHVARLPQSNRAYLSQQSQEFRDGSSTASPSGADDAYPSIGHRLKIHGVEVIGAKQKKGDVSLGERLVGVKEYTVYVLRVWSGKDQWEVERRYRDFLALYRQLKTLFADNGWTLPHPWSHVQRQSRKIFGNVSPDVVSERSALIQECLRSILHFGSLYSLPSSLIWFLSSQDIFSRSSTLNTLVTQAPSAFTGGTHVEDVSTFGKTISLVLEIQPPKSMQQLLEAQHCACAGCHKHLDAGKSRMREFVQTLGWGKPRLCEYTGQLFCSSCHTNETAVLPARVLRFWDFTEYSVSQLAKSYLESIYDKPMLCVSAVNPFLFSKVAALRLVMGIRKKIAAMVPFVQCPFRRSLLKRVGSRRYLLENNDFFALRDLVDLSKAAFAALPDILETLSKKILEHITQRCLVCCDLGVPCGARQACEDPSALIFPFQEDVIRRCSSCDSALHEPCFRRLSHCSCGTIFEEGKSNEESIQQVNCTTDNDVDRALNSPATKSTSNTAVGFLSNLFSKSKQEVRGPRNGSPVILMGSLPSTSF